MSFERWWAEIAPVGRSARTGGYFRQPFASAERELATWFAEAAESIGLTVETDGFGNQIAWWDPLDRTTDALPRRDVVLTGSHLDSVLDGGAYDGPLGVVTSLAAVARLREEGVTPARPVGVAVFVEEEGSRFGRACLGSRLALGAAAWPAAGELRDSDGVFLGDAMAAVGLDPAAGASWDLASSVACFVELHVEQGRDLVDREAAIGVATGIWPHGRYRFEFTGEANHAGTTLMDDRHDPMLTYAMTALAANKQARLAGARATFGRVSVAPNATNAVPSAVSAWLDARAASEEGLADLVTGIGRQATERADRDGTQVAVVAESVSGRVDFDEELGSRLAAGHPEGVWPTLPTAAGHDAGILAAAGIPTAMLFVRNPTGVSHSPEESAEPADCLAGVDALAETLRRVIR